MSTNPTLDGPVTSAERFFVAEVLTLVLDGGSRLVAESRHRDDGGIDVLPKGDRPDWLTLDGPQIRAALNQLSTAYPGYTIQCDHLQRIDRLVSTLALNEEPPFDSCLVDAVVEMAVAGEVNCTQPGDERAYPADG